MPLSHSRLLTFFKNSSAKQIPPMAETLSPNPKKTTFEDIASLSLLQNLKIPTKRQESHQRHLRLRSCELGQEFHPQPGFCYVDGFFNDIQWVGEDPRVNLRRGFGGSGNGMSRFVGCGSVPGVGRVWAFDTVIECRSLMEAKGAHIGRKFCFMTVSMLQ
ncbi:hypothetical protein D0Y65_015652 [Glycine soja]|uniref:Uncharacterized protein n=1 Tax=Glycine soja TaxID=3848 RepID=A0A445KDR7_GLYSO|nr:hypothetical protein D0Y65_015652 [Glycine soja]